MTPEQLNKLIAFPLPPSHLEMKQHTHACSIQTQGFKRLEENSWG